MQLFIKNDFLGRTFNYAFVFYWITSEVLIKFILPFDGYGRIGMLLLGCAIIFNCMRLDTWRTFTVPAIAFWGIWVVVEWINWYQIGFMDKNNPDMWFFTFNNFIRAFACMFITVVEMKRDHRTFLRWTLFSFCFYVVLGIMFQVRLGESIRNDSDANVLGNMLPLMSLGMVGCGMMAHYLAGVSKRIVWILFALSFIAVIACATRKAMGGVVILLAVWYFCNVKIFSAKNIFILVFGIAAAYLAFTYVAENTVIGERFTEVEKQSHVYKNNWFLKFMADRAYHYVLGWEQFLQHPIWGIGILNFQHNTHYFVQLHTEYMVQICECGIVGSALFVLFIGSIFKGIFKIYRRHKKIALACLGWMACALFINFTAWSFNVPYYFVMYGILIGTCQILSSKAN